MEPIFPGPDGFLLERNHPRFASHEALSLFLVNDESRDPSRQILDAGPWKKIPKKQLVQHLLAILDRIGWLYAHDAELDNAHMSRTRLTQLLRVIYKMKLPWTEPELVTLLRLTIPLLEHISPFGPVEYVVEYAKENDLTADLCSALRDYQAAVPSNQCGMAAMQSLWQQMHMLLWMDEWEPLNPSRCWSECIRRDFRAMTGDRKTKWRALLKHLRGNAPVRMPAGWAKEAEPLLAAVGLDDFRQQLCLWFATFRSGEPLPLSVAGSHVLKCMIWFAALTRDEQVKEIAMWLLDVKWRQKRNADKSMIALEVFGISKEELLARKLIKPLPGPGPTLLERLLKVNFMTPLTRTATDHEEDVTIIQGDLHFYRVHRATGRIERVSDNKVLELN